MRDRCGDITDPRIDVEVIVELKGALPLRFAPVGDVDPRFYAPEQIRTDGEIAGCRELVGDLAHYGVNTENFLDDDDRWRLRDVRPRNIS